MPQISTNEVELHFDLTGPGQGLANVVAALDAGVRSFAQSVLGRPLGNHVLTAGPVRWRRD